MYSKQHGMYLRQKCVLFTPQVLIFVMMVIVIALIGIGVGQVSCSKVFSGNNTSDQVTSNALPESTPRSEWSQGTIPFLYQIDLAWANEPYAGSTVGLAGCGPTCLSMVYVDLTGNTDLDPASMASFSERNGFVDSGMTSWLLMSEGAELLGLSSHEVPAQSSSVFNELASGRPIICSVGPGDFTSTGHFIVLAGIDDSGKVIVHDPNSAENSAQVWDCDRILSQCRNLWAFEQA